MFKYIFIILLFNSVSIFSQESDSSSVRGPMEMPEVIVDRNINLNIKSTVKKFPQDTPHLSLSELDSINSLEKQGSLLLPKSRLPNAFTYRRNETAFLNASLGSWVSINTNGGYTFDFAGFDIYTIAGTEVSEGYVENSDYAKIDLSLNSTYNADPKFWIFGSSTTGASFDFNFARYNHYAVFNPEERTKVNLSFLTDTKGSFQGFDFRTGIFTDALTLSDSSNISSSGIGAYLDIENPYRDFKFLGGGEFDIRSDLNQNNNFINAYGGIEYKFQNKIKSRAKLGFYIANGEQKASKGINYEIISSYNPNSNNSLNLNINGGIDRTLFGDLLRRNPYISTESQLFHPEKTVGITASWDYKFATKWAISPFVSYDKYSTYLNFYNIDSARFNISGKSADIVKIGLRSFYEINDANMLNLDFVFQSGKGDSDSLQVTYLPEIDAKLAWSVFWNEDIGTQTYAQFVGKRYFNITSDEHLDQYINLGFSISYGLYDNLFIEIKADNLLNENIYYYNNYQEGGIFGSLGINLKL
jgi:hypothetical protein